jgi:hypothetical protein
MPEIWGPGEVLLGTWAPPPLCTAIFSGVTCAEEEAATCHHRRNALVGYSHIENHPFQRSAVHVDLWCLCGKHIGQCACSACTKSPGLRFKRTMETCSHDIEAFLEDLVQRALDSRPR